MVTIKKERFEDEKAGKNTTSRWVMLREIFGRLDVWTALLISIAASIRQSMFVATFNKWTRYVDDTIETESYLTLVFGFMAYSELIFSVLPGVLIDLCGRSTNKYIDRRIGVALGFIISIVLHLVCNIFWGKSGNTTYAIIAMLSYYAFRSFFFCTLQTSAAELFPVSYMVWTSGKDGLFVVHYPF